MDFTARRFYRLKVKGDIHRYLLAFLVFCLGIAISFIMFTAVREQEKSGTKIEFDTLSSDRVAIITRNISTDLEVLYSVKALYDSSFFVAKDGFQKFTANAIMDHPDILSIDWMPRIPDSDRKAFEEGVSLLEGYPGFQITEREAHDKLVKASHSQEYFPIQYSIPFVIGKKILGFDVNSDPVSREAMREACDTGQAAATGRLTLIRKKMQGFSQKIFAPVYVSGKPHDTIEDRRRNLRGFVAILINIEDLVETALGNLSAGGIDICFYDESAAPDERFLYFHKSRLRKTVSGSIEDAVKIGELNWNGEIDISGRKWQVTCTPDSLFLEKHTKNRSQLILIIGVILTIASAAYLYNIKGHAARIESLIAKRTDDLRNANKALEAEIEWHLNAEEQLSVTTQQWQKTFNAISDRISIQDKNYKLIQVNKAYADLFKMKPGELVGKVCYPIVHGTSEPCLNCPQERTLETKRAEKLECFEPRFNMHMEISTYPIFAANNEVAGTVHIIKDIGEQKKTEEALKEAAALKTHFTSMVSHELRTPLTAIKEGIAIVLDETAGALNNEQKEFLEISKRNVDRLARLINDVLDYQKLESGKFEFEVKENDMNEVIKEVEKTMISVAKNKGLGIILNLEYGLPKFKFDRDKIIQVLTNLINNAIKFTEKGSITVVSGKSGGIVQVAVKDTGPGIKAEDLPRLFRAFEQLEKGKDRRTGGTGLGLSISKEIIDKHGGAIWAESEHGKGATFYFALPFSKNGGPIP